MFSMGEEEAVSQALSSMMRALSFWPSLPAKRTSMRAWKWFSAMSWRKPDLVSW